MLKAKISLTQDNFDEQLWKVLLVRAQYSPFHGYRKTVTDFSQWIFNLHHPHLKIDPVALKRGKEGEIRLQEAELNHLPKLNLQATLDTNLREIYADPLTHKGKPLTISSLLVNGIPLVGVPDIVLKDCSTGDVIVIERKVTGTFINVPASAWPNFWAQLWCYSWADSWRDAPEVILIGDIYRYPKLIQSLGTKVHFYRH